jgi:hypothetical protein
LEFVGGHDDNNRSVREKTRLRGTVEEPSSGYSYHDESRVESFRGSGRASAPKIVSGASPANDAAPAPPNSARVTKQTMVGGFSSPELASAVNDARAAAASSTHVASWPPMPSVPPEFEGAADSDVGSEAMRDESLETMPTDPPRSSHSQKPGGAIWEAVPSVIHSNAPPGDESEHKANEEVASSIQQLMQDSVDEDVASKPLNSPSMRARIARVEAGYGDARTARVAPLVERGAWEQLNKDLAAERDLPPTLSLLHIIARREVVDDKTAAPLTRDAIKLLATLLEVPEHSPIALMLAKRLLRRNRAPTQAPATAGISAGLVALGLALGIGAGYLFTRIFL